jgi:hypothetical protein
MSRGLLKTLELVRSYSVPIRDDRISKLITWYVKALQKAIDMAIDMTGIILSGDIASQSLLERVKG